MSLVIQIEGREAIPVRAIPFLTCWQTMTPDALALALSGDEHFYCFESVLANRAIGGEALQQRWWQSNVVRPLQALSDKLKATEITHETGLQDFHSESLKLLPAGVYVWRDEFEQAHQRHYSGTTLPVDFDGNVVTLTESEVAKLTATHRERIALDFSPLIATELYALVMDGFPAPQNHAPKHGAATPAPVVADGEVTDPAKPNWRHLIQAEAWEHWLRLRASGCNPSVYSISGDLAKWCADKGIKGDKGQDPKAGTIRNSVLGGGNWTPPHHSVSEAKKYIAQTAQTKVAQTKK